MDPDCTSEFARQDFCRPYCMRRRRRQETRCKVHRGGKKRRQGYLYYPRRTLTSALNACFLDWFGKITSGRGCVRCRICGERGRGRLPRAVCRVGCIASWVDERRLVAGGLPTAGRCGVQVGRGCCHKMSGTPRHN